jgi:hypothetical protein
MLATGTPHLNPQATESALLFLDMRTGLHAMECEPSTAVTAIMMAGILTAAAYFTADNEKEIELRKFADILYGRVDWQ